MAFVRAGPLFAKNIIYRCHQCIHRFSSSAPWPGPVPVAVVPTNSVNLYHHTAGKSETAGRRGKESQRPVGRPGMVLHSGFVSRSLKARWALSSWVGEAIFFPPCFTRCLHITVLAIAAIAPGAKSTFHLSYMRSGFFWTYRIGLSQP